MHRVWDKIFKPGGNKDSLTSSVQETKPSASKERIGLFELCETTQQTAVDVVTVHGLQGHPYHTWTHENGFMWLKDFLPSQVPFARIMTFGYDSTVAFSKSVAAIDDMALDLLNRLSAKRTAIDSKNRKTPRIVFIGHSLGGILIKKALILAHERSSDPAFKDILDNTRAVAFLGVPHNGSDSAWWANLAANAMKAAIMSTSTNTALVADLKRDSSALINISKQFVDRGRDLTIYTFYETKRLAGVVVVDAPSARIGGPNEKLFPVDENHKGICKFESARCPTCEVVGFWTVQLVKSVGESMYANPPTQDTGPRGLLMKDMNKSDPLQQSKSSNGTSSLDQNNPKLWAKG